MTTVEQLEMPVIDSLSAYGTARSSVQGTPLSAEELRKTDAYWRACKYLALGMIYLQDNWQDPGMERRVFWGLVIWKGRTLKFIRRKAKTCAASASSSNSFRFPAASAATARLKHRVQSTKAVN